jgi:hypothetical protein
MIGEGAALLAVLAASAFLLLQGVLGLWRPQAVRCFLDGFASSAAAHFGELAARIVVGLGFVGYAAQSAWPTAFAAFGWLLMLTSLPMLLVPWRWHRRFAQRAVPLATRWMPPYALACLCAGLAVLAGVVIAPR